MNSELYEWMFWIIIGASAILGFIAIQSLFSSITNKDKKEGKDISKDDSV